MNTIENDSLSNTLGKLINQSFQTYKVLLDAGLKGAQQNIGSSSDCDTCPPKEQCPPKSIASIYRKAMAEERIVVPFILKNTCSHAKSYRIGLRSVTNQDGNPAPNQPYLNKNIVNLQPNAQERVLLQLDLTGFAIGKYHVEIVVREKEFNQNILLTIEVADHTAAVISPLDEKQYRLKWQSWKTHFYCEPKNRKPQRIENGN